MKGGPVLVLAPKNLLLQWQDELRRMLGVPSARWLDGRWITEDGAEWQIGAHLLPAHHRPVPHEPRHRRQRQRPGPALRSATPASFSTRRTVRAAAAPAVAKAMPNKLLEFMLSLAPRTQTLLLGSATPIQTDRMELFDLMRILHHGCERVLGGIGSNWSARPDDALDLVAGQLDLPPSASELWAWIKDPLIPRGEATLASQIRNRLGVADHETSVAIRCLRRCSGRLCSVAIEARGSRAAAAEQPVRPPRGQATPARPQEPRRLPSVPRGAGPPARRARRRRALMPEHMEAAYEEARAYCNALAKSGSGATAGFMKTLLLRRIGSSLRAGLSTARKLLANDFESLALEEEGEAELGLASAESEAQARLRKAIDLLDAAGDNDPKLGLVLKHLRSKGWAERGCILFSQYLDTVLWIAGHLATAFADQRVGVYGGQGNCFLWENGRRRGAERDEIQALVRDGRLRLLVATDAASEGLNLQRLSTLINIDLPWNPARLEQRKGRIDRIGQLANTIEVLNLRYRGSVEDDVHRALSGRLQAIRDVFGTVPDTLEDVWVLSALGKAEDAKRRIEEVPAQHPFELRYANDVPASAWERCTQVLDKQDVTRALKQGW